KRSKVLLPHPLRPTMARNSPGAMDRSRLCNTVFSPNRLVTCRTDTASPASLSGPAEEEAFALLFMVIRSPAPAQPFALHVAGQNIRELAQQCIEQYRHHDDVGLHEFTRVHGH